MIPNFQMLIKNMQLANGYWHTANGCIDNVNIL